MTADADLLERYVTLDTATVSDALDACGLPPGQGGLGPMWGRPRIAGFAATVELEPLIGEHAGAHILTEAIAVAGAGNVMVVATGGRTDVSSWGGIVSVGAAARSIRGVVTDGACRDVDQARELGFPVFARAPSFTVLFQCSLRGRPAPQGMPRCGARDLRVDGRPVRPR